MRVFLALSIVALVLAPVSRSARAGEEKTKKVQPHADADVKKATARFEQDFASDDMDKRLRILGWYGQYVMHKTVLKRLKKIWLKDKNVELQAVAAKGLGCQLQDPKAATAALMEGLKKYEGYASRESPTGDEELLQVHEAAALTNALESLGKLGVKPDKKGWNLIKGLIDHPHDDVCIAMLNWCGATKEWRALKLIHEWFEFYPDGYSWSGGSVKVDTGAAGNKDTSAAKAKFHAKYGGRARKARPAAHAAMKKALHAITGRDFEKPDELLEWMKQNKALLKKNGA